MCYKMRNPHPHPQAVGDMIGVVDTMITVEVAEGATMVEVSGKLTVVILAIYTFSGRFIDLLFVAVIGVLQDILAAEDMVDINIDFTVSYIKDSSNCRDCAIKIFYEEGNRVL